MTKAATNTLRPQPHGRAVCTVLYWTGLDWTGLDWEQIRTPSSLSDIADTRVQALGVGTERLQVSRDIYWYRDFTNRARIMAIGLRKVT